MSTLIKNGRIVTAVDDYNADIFIEDEKITQIGKNLEMGACLLYTSPSPRDRQKSRMPSSA